MKKGKSEKDLPFLLKGFFDILIEYNEGVKDGTINRVDEFLRFYGDGDTKKGLQYINAVHGYAYALCTLLSTYHHDLHLAARGLLQSSGNLEMNRTHFQMCDFHNHCPAYYTRTPLMVRFA